MKTVAGDPSTSAFAVLCCGMTGSLRITKQRMKSWGRDLFPQAIRCGDAVFHSHCAVNILEVFLHRLLNATNYLTYFPIRFAFAYPQQHFLLPWC